jgi:hypothetical protein
MTTDILMATPVESDCFIKIPVDLLDGWPWLRSLNPHYREGSPSAISEFLPELHPRLQTAYEACKCGTAAIMVVHRCAHEYPQISWVRCVILRAAKVISIPSSTLGKFSDYFAIENHDICIDLMDVFLIVDTYTDVAGSDEAEGYAKSIMNVLRFPYGKRPSMEWLGDKVARMYAVIYRNENDS